MRFIFTTFLLVFTYISVLGQCEYDYKLVNPKQTDETIRDIIFINDTLGYALGEYKAIFKTIDGGSNWEIEERSFFTERHNVKYGMELSITGDSIFIYGLPLYIADSNFNNIEVIEPTFNGNLLVFTGFYVSPKGWWYGESNNFELYVSKDKGISWEVVEGMGASVDISFLNSEIGFITTNDGKVYKSIDGGESWGLLYSNSSFNFFDLNVINENELIIGCYNGILITRDGGNNWEYKSILNDFPNNGVQEIEFFNVDSGYIRIVDYDYNEDNIIKTADNGNSWEQVTVSSELNTKRFTSFNINNNTAYLTGTYGLLAKIELINFNNYEIISGANTPRLEKADINSNGEVIVVGDKGQIMTSSDYGNTFYLDTLPYEEFLFNHVEYIGNDTIIIAGGEFASSRGVILGTIDGGNNWNKILSVNNQYIKRADVNTNNLIVGMGTDTIYYSNNFGNQWSRINIGLLGDNQELNEIKCINDSTWIVTSTGPEFYIVRTEDYGSSWGIVYTGNNEDYAKSIDFINDTTGFLCGGNALFLKTIDGGKTWNQLSGPYWTNYYTGVFSVSNDLVYTTTYPYLAKSFDGGDTWTRMGDIRFSNEMTDLIATNKKSLILVGEGGTIVKLEPEQLLELSFASDTIEYCSDEPISIEFEQENNVIYNWILNDQLVSNTNTLNSTAGSIGNNSLVLIRKNSCEFTDSLEVIVEILDQEKPQKPSISYANDTLYTNAVNNIQWLYNGEIITGENLDYIIPIDYGEYEVVDSNECGTNRSDKFIFDATLSSTNWVDKETFKVYPNPGDDFINVTVPKYEVIDLIEIINLDGVSVKIHNSNKTDQAVVPIDDLMMGTYIMKIMTDENYYTKLILIKR